MSKSKEKNTILKDAIVLFVITLIAGLALGFVNDITKGPIQKAKDKEKAEAYQSVYKEADTFNDIDKKYADITEASQKALEEAGITNVVILEALEAKKGDQVIGHVMTVSSSEGYGGEVPITLGVDLEGTIVGMEVLKNSETSGFGSKASEPAFKDQFVGIKAPEIKYVKGAASADNEISAISGATKTSNAVTKAVNAGLYFAYNMVK